MPRRLCWVFDEHLRLLVSHPAMNVSLSAAHSTHTHTHTHMHTHRDTHEHTHRHRNTHTHTVHTRTHTVHTHSQLDNTLLLEKVAQAWPSLHIHTHLGEHGSVRFVGMTGHQPPGHSGPGLEKFVSLFGLG